MLSSADIDTAVRGAGFPTIAGHQSVSWPHSFGVLRSVHNLNNHVFRGLIGYDLCLPEALALADFYGQAAVWL